MTKFEVLKVFSESSGFLVPDDVRVRLKPWPDRLSIYSYLLRLARQGLLQRAVRPWWRTESLTEGEHAWHISAPSIARFGKPFLQVPLGIGPSSPCQKGVAGFRHTSS